MKTSNVDALEVTIAKLERDGLNLDRHAALVNLCRVEAARLDADPDNAYKTRAAADYAANLDRLTRLKTRGF